MTTNNVWNSNIPVSISQGGTNSIAMSITDGTIYYDGTNLKTADTHNAGNILVSQGGAAIPTYALGWVLIATQSATASTNIDFTSIGSYTNYMLVIDNLTTTLTAQVVIAEISNDNGATWKTAGYDSGVNFGIYNTNGWTNANSTARFNLSNRSGVNAVTIHNGTWYFFGMNTSGFPSVIGKSTNRTTSTVCNSMGFGTYTTSAIVANAIRISDSVAAAYTAGTISLYGQLQ